MLDVRRRSFGNPSLGRQGGKEATKVGDRISEIRYCCDAKSQVSLILGESRRSTEIRAAAQHIRRNAGLSNFAPREQFSRSGARFSVGRVTAGAEMGFAVA